eukprot:m.287051 g.287051  ORF g.287051 m.287051 type:complete len:66 (-) comp11695_c0_seq1:660-857(-)
MRSTTRPQATIPVRGVSAAVGRGAHFGGGDAVHLELDGAVAPVALAALATAGALLGDHQLFPPLL